MVHTPLVSFKPVEGGVSLPGLPLLVDPGDYEGVQIAARNLADDLEQVTGQKPKILKQKPAGQDDEPLDGVILLGSVERSSILRSLIDEGWLDVRQIDGKWESCMTTTLSLPWTKKCFLIAGSDKRGAIFGIYTLSEQIGVSPWHWWADVPVQPHGEIYALPTTTYQGEPSVRYRGLFINDEAPALTSWVHEKIGPKYNFDFYKRVFELLLRLKANFLWPAMWSGHPFPGSSFFADDARNQVMANAYGIVLSTSHHEPMQRSTTEWRARGDAEWAWLPSRDKITKFFEEGAGRAEPYESFITLGMRGEGDEKMKSDDPKTALAEVLKTQRQIIQKTYGREDGERQLMALYKEVLEYYEAGLAIPDDVTLMFPDDNFGNIRRLPTDAERKRTGGLGLYYHLEYVGRPRGYKWINTNSCGKIYQQLRRAYDHGITNIWVINVGDIKPLELPFTFAMSMAWDINCVAASRIPDFFSHFSAQSIGTENAGLVADLLLQHDRLLAIRKHEHLEADTLSVLNYREAETVLSRWKTIEDAATQAFARVDCDYKAAFFQLVLHPIKASGIYTELRIAQAKNKLYGQQRRTSTNAWAKRVLHLFDEDFALSQLYHNNPWMGDKWNHIMRQPHYGYSTQTWHDPSRDLITGLCYVQQQQDSNPIAGWMGVAVEGHPGIRPGLINEETDRMQPSKNDLVPGLTVPVLSPYSAESRYFEIYSRGSKTFQWTAAGSEPWIHLSSCAGDISVNTQVDPRIEISIDWPQVPVGYDGVVHVAIRSSEGDFEQVHVPVVKRPLAFDFHGFVEADGYIAIEPGEVGLTSNQLQCYEHHPYLGRTMNGVIGRRSSMTALDISAEHIPFLNYDIYTFSEYSSVILGLCFTMALETSSEDPLTYDIAIDGTITSQTKTNVERRL
ncbi:hypothetical protein ACMYSQ_012449 [Aspergillus niger]